MSQQLSVVEQSNRDRIIKYWEMHRKQLLNDHYLEQDDPLCEKTNWMSVSNSQLSEKSQLQIEKFVVAVQSIQCVYTNSMAAQLQCQARSSSSTTRTKPRLQNICSIQQTIDKSPQFSPIQHKSPQQQFSLEPTPSIQQSSAKKQETSNKNSNKSLGSVVKSNQISDFVVQNQQQQNKVQEIGNQKYKVLIKQAQSYSQSTINKQASFSNHDISKVQERINRQEIMDDCMVGKGFYGLGYKEGLGYKDGLGYKKGLGYKDGLVFQHHSQSTPQQLNKNMNSSSLKYSPISSYIDQITPISIAYKSPSQPHSSNPPHNQKTHQFLTLNTIQFTSKALSQDNQQKNTITKQNTTNKNTEIAKSMNTCINSVQLPKGRHSPVPQSQQTMGDIGMRQSNNSIITIDRLLSENSRVRKSVNNWANQYKYSNEKVIQSNITTGREYKSLNSTIINSYRNQDSLHKNKNNKNKNKKMQVTLHEDTILRGDKYMKFQKLLTGYQQQLSKTNKQKKIEPKISNTDAKNVNEQKKYVNSRKDDKKKGCYQQFCPQNCWGSKQDNKKKQSSQGLKLSMNGNVKGVSLLPKQDRRYDIKL